jgi:hypothetical protein
MPIYQRYASNVIVESIGSANTVTFQNTGGVANVIITGDLTVSGNASLAGNISGDKLFNGTTSIEIQTASGNANITVGGTSNVFVVTPTGTITTGISSVTGNVTGGNINTAGLVSATGNINGGNLTIASGNIVIGYTGTATTSPMIRFSDSNTAVTTVGANVGSIDWFTNDATGAGARITARIRAVYEDVNGNANIQIQTGSTTTPTTRITVIGSSGNVGVANTAPLHTFAVTGNSYISGTKEVIGNITGGNINTAGRVTATGNLVSGANVIASGFASITGNITGGNIISVGVISGSASGISATGNVRGGNVNSDNFISATGNIYAGGGLQTQGNASATGTVMGATALFGNANITANMFGTGIGVENIVWQSIAANISSASMANVGSLGFLALAGSSYKFEAYMPVIPAGTTTTAFSTYFDVGTCYYTVESQTTPTAGFAMATSSTSGTTGTTQSMTGTTPRTVRITGTIFSAGNANVAIQAQTNAANLVVPSGSYLTYTRIG